MSDPAFKFVDAMRHASSAHTVATDEKLTVLVLGCGRKQDPAFYGLSRMDGTPVEASDLNWITLDADPWVQPAIVCTLGVDPIPMPDDSVDLAIAMHVIEHIGTQGQTQEWFQFWEELYRVLKPGGRLQFECPLATSVWAWADPTHTRGITEYSFLYFMQDSYRHKHSAIPTYRIKCDFESVVLERRPDAMNPDVRKLEEHTMIGGILRAKKPLRPWWEDKA